jgi:hypothetical protein
MSLGFENHFQWVLSTFDKEGFHSKVNVKCTAICILSIKTVISGDVSPLTKGFRSLLALS